MAMRIEYTSRFKRKFNKILACGDNYYSQQMIKELTSKIKHYKNLLSENPYLGAKEELLSDISEEYRSLVINKRIKLIYLVLDSTLYITDIWDTRQSIETLIDDMA